MCLVFWKSEPQYAYKRYAIKKHVTRARFSFLDPLYMLHHRPKPITGCICYLTIHMSESKLNQSLELKNELTAFFVLLHLSVIVH